MDIVAFGFCSWEYCSEQPNPIAKKYRGRKHFTSEVLIFSSVCLLERTLDIHKRKEKREHN